jgi:hypothetical protein
LRSPIITGSGSWGQLTRPDIIQSYVADLLLVTEGGVTTDQLDLGSSLTLELHQDGTATGRLYVPEVEGEEFDVDLPGTFLFDDAADRVTFQQDADTFVRDMAFTAKWVDEEVNLEGQETFTGGTVRVVLIPN